MIIYFEINSFDFVYVVKFLDQKADKYLK